ncbi:SIMPL domain-containing protein [Oceaniovalibus sp. ACAM 378]|uniref:SIMPL domain-containing protein n=1 Tax=Oceaniovalibus sp. ACAM 378 TaxID=2599923 RepID=UPI0011D76B21|nr:SIMPL domain-containing protein [Oceaniovalibus sp. ACAM 378]TYB88049.1 DUF541 domain-containing protein [Oceaniovalibus sp. ACAM 378]
MQPLLTTGRRISALALALCALLGAGAIQAGELRVSGEGVISAVPDMAQLSLGVEAQDSTAAAALSQVSERIGAVIDALKAQGIAATDMQTGQLSVRPEYQERSKAEDMLNVLGYVANSDLSVRVRDLDAVGELIDAVAKAGGNTFSGISFDVQDRAPLLILARKAAVADAMAKAALFAGAAGVTLGSVETIDETGMGGGPSPMMDSAALRSMPIAAGEIDVTATVHMVFDIDD